MAVIEILEFTDPQCPFAWSAEPTRRRIYWLYGDRLSLAPRMVGLHESAAAMERKGMTPGGLAAGATRLARMHHMPMVTDERPLAASISACRAVVATRQHAPAHERAMLRALRVRNFSGDQLDDPATLRHAAEDVGIDPAELDAWLTESATESALRDDMSRARHPTAEALALPSKLASTEDGGKRYTCPSWELTAGNRTISIPGFQPTPVYEVAIANLDPEMTRRANPSDVAEVLRWAGEPLATAEVAAVCDIALDEARAALGRVAHERVVGQESLWSL